VLFDLRGRGRRRTVQIIYLSLALLMGGGLVLFGIGGDVQGGLFDAFQEESTQGSGTEELEQRVRAAEVAAQRNPRDPQALAQLARLRYQLAVAGEGFDQQAGRFTAQGRERLRGAARAWERYVALDPERPDDRVAALMVQAYGPAALNQPREAVRAMEIVVDQREPTSNLYAQLAILAYQADQTRKGDLAGDRAVELADRDERRDLRQTLEQAKRAVEQAQQGQGAGPGGGQGAAP
jgi:hypothetical protein